MIINTDRNQSEYNKSSDNHGEFDLGNRPEFFYFSFYRPSRANFLKIEKKIKRDFFQFYFCISLRLMPVQYWSSIMFFRFVFSSAARLIELKIKFIRTIFQFN